MQVSQTPYIYTYGPIHKIYIAYNVVIQYALHLDDLR